MHWFVALCLELVKEKHLCNDGNIPGSILIHSFADQFFPIRFKRMLPHRHNAPAQSVNDLRQVLSVVLCVEEVQLFFRWILL